MLIRGLRESADRLNEIWLDQIGRSICDKLRLESDELMRVELRQELILETTELVRQFCAEVIGTDESDGEKTRRYERRFLR